MNYDDTSLLLSIYLMNLFLFANARLQTKCRLSKKSARDRAGGSLPEICPRRYTRTVSIMGTVKSDNGDAHHLVPYNPGAIVSRAAFHQDARSSTCTVLERPQRFRMLHLFKQPCPRRSCSTTADFLLQHSIFLFHLLPSRRKVHWRTGMPTCSRVADDIYSSRSCFAAMMKSHRGSFLSSQMSISAS